MQRMVFVRASREGLGFFIWHIQASCKVWGRMGSPHPIPPIICHIRQLGLSLGMWLRKVTMTLLPQQPLGSQPIILAGELLLSLWKPWLFS